MQLIADSGSTKVDWRAIFDSGEVKSISTEGINPVFMEDERIIGIELPNFVELVVIETEPGFKGDTATGATKPATVEGGAVVYVPLFVEQGTKLMIDTRTGEYMKRV